MDAAIATGDDIWATTARRGRDWARLWLASVAILGGFISPTPASGDDDQAPRASQPADPTARGKLVICGGGILPVKLRKRFVDLAGGPQARVVVITTASVWADSEEMEAKLSFWREQDLANLTILHTRSRQTADDPQFAQPLREATGVWFVGGNQNWLTETYLGTLTEREIRGVLARSGVVGGTSAGAAIMSPVMIRRDKPDVETGPGFGFLPGTVVDQHFLKRNRQGRLLKVLGAHPELVGLGIDEGTGVVVEGHHMSVVGDSRVVVCSPATHDAPESVQALEPGAEADLLQLRTLVAHLAKPADAVADSITPVDAAQDSTLQPTEAAPPDHDPAVKVGQ